MWEDKERRKQETTLHFEDTTMALVKHFDGSKGIAGYKDEGYGIWKYGTAVDDIIIFDTIDELCDSGWTITT